MKAYAATLLWKPQDLQYDVGDDSQNKTLGTQLQQYLPFSLCFLCHYDDLGWTFVVSNPMARTNLMAKVSWALIWELNFLKAWPIDWWSSYNEPRSIDEL